MEDLKMDNGSIFKLGLRDQFITVYKKQVAENVAMLELEPDDMRRVYKFMVDNWLNPGDAEMVAGEMNLI